MDTQFCIAEMKQNARVIARAVETVSPKQARWKPAADEWSILEVVNHLYDEERRDFRVRIDHVLNRAGEPWPAIDPAGWVTAEKYNERMLAPSLENFIAERQSSLAWLATLTNVDWTTEGNAPWGGTIRAGDLLAAWTAHDLLHLRQINELHYLYLKTVVQPYGLAYAGDW